MHELVIATWNVSECVSTQWDIRQGISHKSKNAELQSSIDEIVQLVNSHNIDILCVQEYPLSIKDFFDVTRYIQTSTDLKFFYGVDTYPSFLIENGKIGIAVFSKYEILSARYSPFINPNITKKSKSGVTYFSFDKGLISAKINYHNETVFIITGHAVSFAPFDAKAEDYPESFAEITNQLIIHRPEKNNVILIGDFNTENLFSILPDLSTHMKDCIQGATTIEGKMEGETFYNGRKLDYFLVSPSISVIQTKKYTTFPTTFFV